MEILNAVEEIARSKSLDKELLIEMMEEAIAKSARAKYGAENDVRAEIDRSTGVISLKLYQEVVETADDIEDESRQITLAEAQAEQKDIKVGEFLMEDLPPMDFGRIAAQTAKQVLKQRVREADRERQFEEYKDRTGEIVSGVIKRIEYGNITVDLGRAEAVIRRNEAIPRERLKRGDRVRAYLYEVSRELRGPQLLLSRTHPEFMSKLFAQEVPEIYEGIIEVKAVARDAGSRAKIAVYSSDGSIDPVGACVGMRGSRVQSVVNELHGEKIDIVPWSPDLATFVVNSLQPAEISKVVMDEERQHMDVVVAEDQLALAIGRRGQNVRLASILLGWDIDIMSEEEEAERRAAETKKRAEEFMAALDVDDVISRLLVAEGFDSIEDIAFIELDELARIEGFGEAVATELQNRARIYINKREEEIDRKLDEYEVSDELAEHPDLTIDTIINLGAEGIKTIDDLGDLATDELMELSASNNKMTESLASRIIMKVREAWFEDEDAQNEGAETSEDQTSKDESGEEPKEQETAA